MRTIRVIGRGQLRLRPDTTRLTLTLTGQYPDYDTVLQVSARDTERLRALFTGYGFAPTDLKTLSFTVDTAYESVQEGEVYRQRFAGYCYRTELKLDFPMDNALLGKLLYALAHTPVKPEFRLSYTLRDPEQARNALLEQAVADAREKAERLTRAAGQKLGQVQSIDYTWTEKPMEVQPMHRMLLAKGTADSYALNLEPEEIALTEPVTLTWEILS